MWTRTLKTWSGADRQSGTIVDRVDMVERLLGAMRAEAERHAAARVAQQQRSDEAQREEVTQASVVWGVPREARYANKVRWREEAVGSSIRTMLHGGRAPTGVDFVAMPAARAGDCTTAMSPEATAWASRTENGKKDKSAGV